MIAIAGALCTMLGAVFLYIAAPHQKLLSRPGGRRAAIIGTAILAAALVLLLAVLGPATAVFAWATGAALIWTIIPLSAAWVRRPSETRP